VQNFPFLAKWCVLANMTHNCNGTWQRYNWTVCFGKRHKIMMSWSKFSLIDNRFWPWRKSMLTKQCLQQNHWQTQPIKTRPWISFCKFNLWTSPALLPPTCYCRCSKSQITSSLPSELEPPWKHINIPNVLNLKLRCKLNECMLHPLI
jgi:hypothetical protein